MGNIKTPGVKEIRRRRNNRRLQLSALVFVLALLPEVVDHRFYLNRFDSSQEKLAFASSEEKVKALYPQGYNEDPDSSARSDEDQPSNPGTGSASFATESEEDSSEALEDDLEPGIVASNSAASGSGSTITPAVTKPAGNASVSGGNGIASASTSGTSSFTGSTGSNGFSSGGSFGSSGTGSQDIADISGSASDDSGDTTNTGNTDGGSDNGSGGNTGPQVVADNSGTGSDDSGDTTNTGNTDGGSDNGSGGNTGPQVVADNSGTGSDDSGDTTNTSNTGGGSDNGSGGNTGPQDVADNSGSGSGDSGDTTNTGNTGGGSDNGSGGNTGPQDVADNSGNGSDDSAGDTTNTGNTGGGDQGPIVIADAGDISSEKILLPANENDNVISPGNSPGVETFSGDQIFDNLFFIELAGTVSVTEYDVVDVDGNASFIDGDDADAFTSIFEVVLIALNEGDEVFAPSAGDFFDIFIADSILTGYDGLEFIFPELDNDLFFLPTLAVNDSVIRLLVNSEEQLSNPSNELARIPEPATWLLFLLGMLLIYRLRRKA